ncbi:phosphatase PAP2 family protein [Pontibacter sp. BT310]|uniref:Phosphatase PAP2 family protein n=1 Tax=Pontibacter populi TaxID=890055 RepID=A0ABS6X9F2_9BACT|nr:MULTISPECIES: phosphatase PAP2 family protein [Pontibacter]MBJ6116962.1 phosphatase PAP2 family protein [Pontibacter sp. BT310]MBR0569386.1 phosphatase PAP2 family protein [Microvirga sp. STS03]MBW3363815.1 phosphatase PAP2 family protein [Pontibacter populi]
MIKSFYKKVAAGVALFTVELIFVWLLFIACVVVFFYISSQVLQGDELGMDDAAFDFAATIASPGLDNFIKVITFFASRQFLTPAALLLVAYFVFIKRHRWYSLKVPVVALGSITLNVVLKYFFDRPRPIVPMVEAHGLSFPSGHTMVAASFYGLLIYLVWQNVKQPALKYTLVALLSAFVILIGFSRIYLRVHYATDVLAGFAAGFMWVFIGIYILRRLERYSRKEITPVLIDEPVTKE